MSSLIVEPVQQGGVCSKLVVRFNLSSTLKDNTGGFALHEHMMQTCKSPATQQSKARALITALIA